MVTASGRGPVVIGWDNLRPVPCRAYWCLHDGCNDVVHVEDIQLRFRYPQPHAWFRRLESVESLHAARASAACRRHGVGRGVGLRTHVFAIVTGRSGGASTHAPRCRVFSLRSPTRADCFRKRARFARAKTASGPLHSPGLTHHRTWVCTSTTFATSGECELRDSRSHDDHFPEGRPDHRHRADR